MHSELKSILSKTERFHLLEAEKKMRDASVQSNFLEYLVKYYLRLSAVFENVGE